MTEFFWGSVDGDSSLTLGMTERIWCNTVVVAIRPGESPLLPPQFKIIELSFRMNPPNGGEMRNLTSNDKI